MTSSLWKSWIIPVLGTLMKSPTFRRQLLISVILLFGCIFLIHTLTDDKSLVGEGFVFPSNASNHKSDIAQENNGIDPCRCNRHLKYDSDSQDQTIWFNQTTCSHDAFRRGPHQKVVGFSFYGDINSDYSKKKGYFQGIVGNLKLMPKYYPGWIMRLYYDLDKKDPVFKDLCDLACSNPILDICDARHLPGTPFVDSSKVFAMNWRFFPTLDPQVDTYISRDLDSRFSDREQAAVQEWIQSSKSFHFMRDHPNHGTHILGSSWGTKMDGKHVRENWAKSWRKGFADKITWAKRNDYGPDQGFLSRFVWPWAKHDSISHDSYTCKRYPYTQAWPVQRRNEPNNFISAVVAENHTLWQVDVLLSRDLDSRFSFREVAAVIEWLETEDKSIHAMRDNPAHNIGLLGASWGTDLTKDNARGRWKKSWKKMWEDPLMYANRTVKGPDQILLRTYVWNSWGKKSSIQHDSYLCEQYPGSIGFPTQRLMETNNYVASVWNDKEMIRKKCPKKCRRQPDWIYC